MLRVAHEYSSELSQLPLMRAAVGEACRRHWDHPADASAIAHLELALTEAAANIIEHAYGGAAGRPILLVLEMDGDRATLTLYHEGCDFDPKTAPPPVFNGSRQGGFGVYMIGRLMDEVRHFRDSDGRCAVRLVKNRTPKERP
ncbi:MAG: ATP-binding protein [Gemmataceae bacterium]